MAGSGFRAGVKVARGSSLKVHAKCVMGVEWVRDGVVVSVDYGLEVMVTAVGKTGGYGC